MKAVLKQSVASTTVTTGGFSVSKSGGRIKQDKDVDDAFVFHLIIVVYDR